MLSMMYRCLLRPGETVVLCRGDLWLPGGLEWFLPVDVVVLRSPKTTKTGGRIQQVVVYDETTLRLCRFVWQTWRSTRRLCPSSTKDFELWFRWSVVRLGLGNTQYTP